MRLWYQALSAVVFLNGHFTGRGQTLVADQPQGESRQDRREDRHARALRDLPDGGGCRAEPIIWIESAADRWLATTTDPSLKAGIVQRIIAMGVCPIAAKPSKTSFLNTISPMPVRSPPA